MLKQNKMAKLHKIKIKYSLIVFVLVVFIFALYQLSPTFMRYYFDVTGRAVGYAKERRGATFTVVFHANTGTGTMEDQTIPCGVPTALNENTFTKPECSFKEWNTEEDGSGTSYLDEAQIASGSEDTIDLYAQWQDGVAMIVETGVRYTTFQKAIDAAGTSGQKTIKFLTNISETAKINKNQNIVLDLQKYTLSNKGTDGQAVPLTNEGTCYISNGTITTSATSAAINNNQTGTLIISGGNVTSTGTKQAIYNDKGRLEISGGYFSSVSNQRATVQNQAGGTLIITGGTIISKTANGNYGAVQNNGIMTIGTQDGSISKTSPLIQGVTYGIYASTNFTFNDGIIKGKTAAISAETKAQIGEAGYSIAHLDETIDGEVYRTAYLAITNTITFNPNGGSVTEPTRNVENGNPIGTLPEPTRNGYGFVGWFTLQEGGDEINASTLVTSDTTYFAHWTEICTITFNPNGGTVAENEREVLPGEEVGTLPIPTREGYRFDGWFTLAEGGNEISASTLVTANATYFAHWTKIHTITFNPNGGTVENGTKAVIDGEELGTLPTPTREGYRFDGWFTLAEGGDEISASTVPTTDVTYFAHWSKKHTITFNPNEGTVAEGERTVVDGETVGTLPVPTRSGYVFDGWFTLTEGGDEISASTVPTGDTTYYAHWNRVYVAEMNGTQYYSVQEAITAAPTRTPSTITLLRDIAEAITVGSTKNIILDFQNYTVNNDGDNPVITNNGTVEIISGTFTSNANTKATINNNSNANITISGGNVISTGTRSSIYNDGGTVLITGNAYLRSTATGKPDKHNLERGTVHNLANGTIIITGGTIIGVHQTAVSNSGTLTIGTDDETISTTSPVLQGKTYGVKSDVSFGFYDGILKGVTDAIDGTATENPATREVDGTETIGGQTYKTKCLELIP